MPDVLPVSTFEIGDPIAVFVPVKIDNASFHSISGSLSLDGRELIFFPSLLMGKGCYLSPSPLMGKGCYLSPSPLTGKGCYLSPSPLMGEGCYLSPSPLMGEGWGEGDSEEGNPSCKATRRAS